MQLLFWIGLLNLAARTILAAHPAQDICHVIRRGLFIRRSNNFVRYDCKIEPKFVKNAYIFGRLEHLFANLWIIVWKLGIKDTF